MKLFRWYERFMAVLYFGLGIYYQSMVAIGIGIFFLFWVIINLKEG